MAQSRSSVYYYRMCQKALQEIYYLAPDQGKRFLLLKKKAQKYLLLAQEAAKREGHIPE